MNNLVLPNFEEKGKIFTEVVSKIAVGVILQTTTNRITGKIHVRSGERIKDEIDRNESCLAITDATIFDTTGNAQIFQTSFLAIQKAQLVWVVPKSEIKINNQGDE
jgi:hypothetical protein